MEQQYVDYTIRLYTCDATDYHSSNTWEPTKTCIYKCMCVCLCSEDNGKKYADKLNINFSEIYTSNECTSRIGVNFCCYSSVLALNSFPNTPTKLKQQFPFCIHPILCVMVEMPSY